MANRNTQRTITNARKLRRDSTKPEQAVWRVLKNRGLAGLKFRRQHPIDPFIADFYCHEGRLVIELDGDSHDQKSYRYDMRRQATLEAKGFRVLRLSNDDVFRDLEAVAIAILRAVGRDPQTGEKLQISRPSLRSP